MNSWALLRMKIRAGKSPGLKLGVGVDQPGLAHHVEVIGLDDQRPLTARPALVAFVSFHMASSIPRPVTSHVTSHPQRTHQTGTRLACCAGRCRSIESKAMLEGLFLPSDLPCPSPLDEAVTAGVFGFTDAEPHRPNPDEIQSLTEEHACHMLSLLSDLKHLEWCNQHTLNPDTEKPPKPEQRANTRLRIESELATFIQQYESCLAVYADAFGGEAAAALDAAIRRFVDGPLAKEAVPVQRQLF